MLAPVNVLRDKNSSWVFGKPQGQRRKNSAIKFLRSGLNQKRTWLAGWQNPNSVGCRDGQGGTLFLVSVSIKVPVHCGKTLNEKALKQIEATFKSLTLH